MTGHCRNADDGRLSIAVNDLSGAIRILNGVLRRPFKLSSRANGLFQYFR